MKVINKKEKEKYVEKTTYILKETFKGFNCHGDHESYCFHVFRVSPNTGTKIFNKLKNILKMYLSKEDMEKIEKQIKDFADWETEILDLSEFELSEDLYISYEFVNREAEETCVVFHK